VAGIVVTTAAIALGTAYGWKVLSRDGSALRVVTIVTALVSGAIGLSYLTR
jgi:hypothetical protein